MVKLPTNKPFIVASGASKHPVTSITATFMGAWFGQDAASARCTTPLPGFWLPGLVLLLSLALSLTAWYIIARQHEEAAIARFERQRDHVIAAIRNRLLAYEHVLVGVQGLFATSDNVDRREFRSYVENLDLERYYPGLQGIGFSQRIARGELPRHVQAVRDERFADYVVRPEQPRAEYTSIIYLEPFDWRNQRAFGYDMFSEPVRRVAMERARDTGLAAVSGKVRLIQETEEDVQAGFLMYLPVYRQGAAIDGLAERRAALQGYVYAPFRMNDLMRGVLGDDVPLEDLKIYSGAHVDAGELLYDSGQTRASASLLMAARFEQATVINIGGHAWTVLLRGTPAFNASVHNQQSLVVLISGMIISLLVSGINWSIATSRDRAIALAGRMTNNLRLTKESMEQANRELSTANLALRREQRERERAHQLLSAVLENIQAGVVACDNEGTLTLFNRATHEFHGLPEQPLPPERWAEHYSLYQADGVTPMSTEEIPLFRALKGEQVRELEMMIVPANGAPARTLLASGQPMLSADGIQLGAVVAMQDISEQKALERRLRAHAHELEQKNRELQDFASVASHDLQEPLRKIQAFGDLVISSEGEALSESGRDYLARMRKSAGRMRALIDDLLELSRISSELRSFIPVDLTHVAEEVIADLDVRVRETGARIEIGMLPRVTADLTQMRQLLQNLIGNALKFKREDRPPHIQIFARRVAKDLPGGRQGEVTAWRIFVEDNGIGFDIKYLDRIFVPFQRLHGRDAFEGTGMGLAICRKIVTRHGGEITAESVPGQGSAFIFTLPCDRSDVRAERVQDLSLKPRRTTA
jgi:PAS domain S-box-containing protein